MKFTRVIFAQCNRVLNLFTIGAFILKCVTGVRRRMNSFGMKVARFVCETIENF